MNHVTQENYAILFAAAKEFVSKIIEANKLPDLQNAGLCFSIANDCLSRISSDYDVVYAVMSEFVEDYNENKGRCGWNSSLPDIGKWTDERIYGLLFLAQFEAKDFK